MLRNAALLACETALFAILTLSIASAIVLLFRVAEFTGVM